MLYISKIYSLFRTTMCMLGFHNTMVIEDYSVPPSVSDPRHGRVCIMKGCTHCAYRYLTSDWSE